MKAIYIPDTFDVINDLKKINNELKNTHSVEFNIRVNDSFNLPGGIGVGGTVLILNEITKAEKLKKISEE
jgi:hypothetical protein